MNKNNLTIKYSIWLFLITIITLLVQRAIFILFDKISFELFQGLLLLTAIVIPFTGLYIIQKHIIKKEYTDIKLPNLLIRIFIISLIYMFLSALYIVCRFHILINIKDGMIMLEKGLVLSSTIQKTIGDDYINLALIYNARYVIDALIYSTFYIAFLIFTFVRLWINDILKIEKDVKKAQQRQFKILIIIVIIVLILEISASFGLKKYETKYSEELEPNIIVEVEKGISNAEKVQIENQLSQIEEIIRYDYKSGDDALNNMKEYFKDINIDISRYNGNMFQATYEITVHSKDKEIVNKKLQMISGLNVNY